MPRETFDAVGMGRRIAERRDAAGLSPAQATKEMCQLLPPRLWPSDEKLNRYERGQITQNRVDFVFLAALAAVCDCSVDDLLPGAGPVVEQVKNLLTGSQCYQQVAA